MPTATQYSFLIFKKTKKKNFCFNQELIFQRLIDHACRNKKCLFSTLMVETS